MSDKHTPGAGSKALRGRPGSPMRPSVPKGQPATGRIVKLLVGQGHGFIRGSNGREVFFHRADVHEGTAFNDLRIGLTVEFELLDDPVSGPRALQVTRHRRSR